MIEVIETELEGVKLIKPPTIYEDFRGTYVETYNKEIYCKSGIGLDFIQDDISYSRKNVLRGIHGDQETWKLVSCLKGTFYIIIVNNDKESGQYKRWQGFTLSDKNNNQLLIPPKFGNGHLVLNEEAIFHYRQTTNYNRAGQFTIMWDDPEYSFYWPTKSPILSLRDSGKII